MSPKISREEAEERLEKAIISFPWLDEFFYSGKESFLEMYRFYHAQLREGDRLVMNLSHHTINGVESPLFSVVLKTKEGREEAIFGGGNYSGMCKSHPFLYPEERPCYS